MYLEKGDILVYDGVAKQNNLTIYRSGALIKTVTHSHIGISALLHAGTIEELSASNKEAVSNPLPKKVVFAAPGTPPLPVVSSKTGQKSPRPKPALPQHESGAVIDDVITVAESGDDGEMGTYATKHNY